MPEKTFAVNFKTTGFRRAKSKMEDVGDEAEEAGSKASSAGSKGAKGFSQMASEAENTQSSLQGLGSRIGSMAKTIGAVLGPAILAGGGAALKFASDAEEMQSKMDAVFGDTADIKQWSQDLGKEIGRSQYQLQQFATTLQDTFVPLGFARDEAQEMSKQTAELAADLASFNNIAEKDAIRKLESGLTGSHRALRDFGVVINQSRLEAELMRSGLAESADAATEQAKAQARLNLIMKDTQDAHGNAADTAGSFKNQLRNLWQEVTETSTTIGQRFLPAASKMVGMLIDLVEGVGESVETFVNMSDATKGTIAVVTGLTAAVSAGFAVWTAWPAIVGGVSAAFSGLATAATTAWAAITSPITGVIAAVATVAGIAGLVVDNWGGLTDFFRQTFSTIRELASTFGTLLVETFRSAWVETKALFLDSLNGLIEIINDGLRAVGAEGQTIDASFGMDEEQLQAQRDRLSSAVSDFQSAGQSAADTFSAEISDGWSAVKKSTSQAVGFVQDQVADLGGLFSFGGGNRASSGPSAPPVPQVSAEGEAIGPGNLQFDPNMVTEQIRQMREEVSTTEAASRRFTSTLSRGLGRTVGQLLTFQSEASSVGEVFRNAGDTIRRALSQVISKLVSAVAQAAALKAAISLIPGFGSVGGASSFAGILKGLLPGAAEGGFVEESGIARIHKGEWIMNEGKVGSLTSAMQSINEKVSLALRSQPLVQAGTVPQPAIGGQIGPMKVVTQVEVTGETRTSGRDLKTVYDTTTRTQARLGH